MQWNSEPNSNDIVSDITFWTGADTTAYPLADRSRHANQGQDRVIAIVLKATNYRFDDTSNSATAILDTSTNLVSGTDKYAISTSWLKIGRVRVKDSSGTWITLNPVDRADLTDQELVASGTPDSFFILGTWIYPRPIPNYNSTGGMEVQYQRGATYFVPGDTTKTPGFATHLHELIPLYASLKYCEAKGLTERAAQIKARIGSPPGNGNVGSGLEKELYEHYAFRDTPVKHSLQPAYESAHTHNRSGVL